MAATLGVDPQRETYGIVPKRKRLLHRLLHMPRAIWSGTISFGLVSVPVKMYSAIDEADLHFHLVHEPDNGRIGYQKFCKTEEKPVPDDEIVKAFEIRKDKHVVLTDEDFAAAKSEGVKSIEISDFVPYDEIDPIYFERTYYLGPQDGGEKPYSLLREAMERTKLAAIGKYVMRDRQHVGCLRVRDRVITLEKMFFHDEIRPVGEIAPSKAKVAKAELEMATTLIEQVHDLVQAREVRGHLPRGAAEDHQGEAEGQDDHRCRAGDRGGAARSARGAAGFGRRGQEARPRLRPRRSGRRPASGRPGSGRRSAREARRAGSARRRRASRRRRPSSGRRGSRGSRRRSCARSGRALPATPPRTEPLSLVSRELQVGVPDRQHADLGDLDHGDVAAVVVDDRELLADLRQRIAVPLVVDEQPGRRRLLAAEDGCDELFAERRAGEPELGLPHRAAGCQ